MPPPEQPNGHCQHQNKCVYTDHPLDIRQTSNHRYVRNEKYFHHCYESFVSTVAREVVPVALTGLTWMTLGVVGGRYGID